MKLTRTEQLFLGWRAANPTATEGHLQHVGGNRTLFFRVAADGWESRWQGQEWQPFTSFRK